MEGWKTWRYALLTALSGVMLLLASAGEIRASFIYGIPPPPPVVVLVEIPPPPPEGEGETPPTDPPIDPPPPSATPEPASIVTALIGVGMAIGVGWRKRRGKQGA